MTRRSLLCALAGMAATLCASRRVGAAPFVNASVAVGYDQPGRAIPENFIGLSYESAVLASPDYLSPGNLSVMGLLRGLGPGAVLRLGGNSSERTVWRDTGDRPEVESFVITPAAIDALAALLNALDWRLIYGLNLARGTPEAAAKRQLTSHEPRGRVSSLFRSATNRTVLGAGPPCVRKATTSTPFWLSGGSSTRRYVRASPRSVLPVPILLPSKNG